MVVVKNLGGLVDILKERSLKDDGRSLGTLTEKEALQIIGTTHGIPYPPGMNSKSVLDLFVRAGWLTEYFGNKDRSYRFTKSR